VVVAASVVMNTDLTNHQHWAKLTMYLFNNNEWCCLRTPTPITTTTTNHPFIVTSQTIHCCCSVVDGRRSVSTAAGCCCSQVVQSVSNQSPNPNIQSHSTLTQRARPLFFVGEFYLLLTHC
jgi:hypothetical protein